MIVIYGQFKGYFENLSVRRITKLEYWWGKFYWTKSVYSFITQDYICT